MVSQSRLKAYAVLGVVFVLGGVAGGAATYAWSQRDITSMLGEEGFERRRFRAFSKELDLTDAQREKVKAIFDAHREEHRRASRDVMERCAGPLREQRAKVDAEIRAVLTPEQQQRFDKLMKERDQRKFGRPLASASGS
jgi:Spy/CpxP family protein refolding chaperone